MGSLESDTTEWLHFHFSLSCIGEGNGNPLQRSCLENPREGKPGGLPSMGSHRVGHDWSDAAAAVGILLPSRRHSVDPWVGKIPWSRKWQPTPVFSPGKSHGQRSPVGYSTWGRRRVGNNIPQKKRGALLRKGASWTNTHASRPLGEHTRWLGKALGRTTNSYHFKFFQSPGSPNSPISSSSHLWLMLLIM